MDDAYLVWSNEHRGWWRPGAWGYTADPAEAGRFTRERAIEICRGALPTAMHLGVMSEIPVRLADLEDVWPR
jgi:hypothetical protein